MVLFVLCKLILQTCMCSHPEGLNVWFLVEPFVYFHTSCVRTAKALVRLGSPEPLLVADVICTIISWAGSIIIWEKKRKFKGYLFSCRHGGNVKCDLGQAVYRWHCVSYSCRCIRSPFSGFLSILSRLCFSPVKHIWWHSWKGTKNELGCSVNVPCTGTDKSDYIFRSIFAIRSASLDALLYHRLLSFMFNT